MTMQKTTYAARLAAIGDRRFADQIADLEATKAETIGDAGRYWQQCDATQRRLSLINAEIAELESLAYDRFDDLASDPL